MTADTQHEDLRGASLKIGPSTRRTLSDSCPGVATAIYSKQTTGSTSRIQNNHSAWSKTLLEIASAITPAGAEGDNAARG
jgi:hypothetical protein